jgi:hypothetical protein
LPVQVALLEQNADRLVLIEFFAPWCASCKALYPKLSKLCADNPQIVIGKVNFEENREIARKLGVKVSELTTADMLEHGCGVLVMQCSRPHTKQILDTQVLPFFHAYHGSMGRVAAFSSSITKIQRVRDCIELFGQPYCDLQAHGKGVDIAQSLPEFESLPVPKDATILQFTEDGSYDREATLEAKRAVAPAAAT